MLATVTILSHPKLICRFNVIPVKLPTGIFVEIDVLVIKIYMEMPRTLNSPKDFERGEQS